MTHLSHPSRSARVAALGATALLSLLVGCAGSTTPVEQAAAPVSPYARPAPDQPYAMLGGERVPVPAIKMGNPATVQRIIEIGQDSHVMDHLTHLTKVIGPRLTGSQAQEDAARWAKGQFESFGLSNVHLFEWGTIATRFDRGPSTGQVFMGDGDEAARDMAFTTLAWTKGTDGPVRGSVVRMPTTPEEFEAIKDELDGAWVLIPNDYSGRRGIRNVGGQMRTRETERVEVREKLAAGEIDFDVLSVPVNPLAEGLTRWNGDFDYNGSPIPVVLDLSDLGGDAITGTMSLEGFHEGPIADATYDANTGELSFGWTNPVGESQITMTIEGDSAAGESTSSSGATYALTAKKASGEVQTKPSDALLAMVLQQNPAGFVSSSRDERVWTTSKTGWRESELSDYGTDVEVGISEPDYDFINSRLADGAPVEVEFNLDHKLVAGPIAVHDVIAEIPGTEWPDEVVIMSAHLDSWNGPGSEGCTDNGTGSSVTLEAARILAAAGAKPKRTIRFILWTGEEQGLLGSRAYVESLSEAERAKISAVFVDDGGTNYQGGAGVADQMAEYMAAATAPMNGRFFSPTDYETAMSDDDPANDADAGLLMVNISTVGKALGQGGGSDHASFNAIGIPGFFWNETGRAQYRYGWHTQHDKLDLAIPEYLAQSATNSAVTTYNLACAPDLLPRSIVEEKTASDE